ncbi:hypothetical protein BJ508DRAFT_315713 [Ascobolus immersus RN42]|uniref:Uncharacterized protein n=1 Tax=Ascobolus immersus RN42 TaxID=1160509 RepID=A0A3N4HNV7_ASCIM|nr:hypothetical protein BJ508DRAFT_315713 [Ascobolus immersus RN42]
MASKPRFLVSSLAEASISDAIPAPKDAFKNSCKVLVFGAIPAQKDAFKNSCKVSVFGAIPAQKDAFKNSCKVSVFGAIPAQKDAFMNSCKALISGTKSAPKDGFNASILVAIPARLVRSKDGLKASVSAVIPAPFNTNFHRQTRNKLEVEDSHEGRLQRLGFRSSSKPREWLQQWPQSTRFGRQTSSKHQRQHHTFCRQSGSKVA